MVRCTGLGSEFGNPKPLTAHAGTEGLQFLHRVVLCWSDIRPIGLNSPQGQCRQSLQSLVSFVYVDP